MENYEDMSLTEMAKTLGEMGKGKPTTDEIEKKIKDNWYGNHVCYYFAQVLSGESSVEETLKDLLSLDPASKEA